MQGRNVDTARCNGHAAPHTYRRRASSVYRTLVVGAATLSLLIIFFTLYQYMLTDPADRQKVSRPRIPVTPLPPADDEAITDGVPVTVSSGQQVKIRESEKMRLTLYAQEGTQARFELEVDQWTPVGSDSDEFSLTKPDIRLRTNSGNAVRVTANRGLLQAQMHGSDIRPSRGHLSGNVVIKVDRLTEKERQALPEPERDTLDPADLVVIELDRIDFDLVYSKVAIPGPFTMHARDVRLQGEDLELRFDVAGSRVEECRIDHGGMLELREATEELNLSIPSLDPREGKQSTLVEWLRATLQAGLEAQHAEQTAAEQAVAQATPTPAPDPVAREAEEDVPIFQPDSVSGKQEERPPVRYMAVFQENVEAAHHVGGGVESRLQADTLEILRDFTQRDRVRVQEQASTKADKAEKHASVVEKKDDRIVVRWTKRLVVRALYDDRDEGLNGAPARVVATGGPVRIFTPEGRATCQRVKFEPGSSQVWLTGDLNHPVVVQSADQGTMTGTKLYSNRTDDQKMYIRVTGPGTLVRNMKPDGDDEVSLLDKDTAATDPALAFADQLEVHGRFVTRARWGLASGYSEREERVVDEAVFTGRVDMREDDTAIDAEKLTIRFSDNATQSGGQQAIKQMIGEGDVSLSQGRDLVRCDHIDISLGQDGKGKLVPHTATATGDVSAVQGDRTIRAADKLVVEFQTISRPLPPFDVLEAHEAAVAKGLDISTIDWESRRRQHQAKRTTEIGVRHLEAVGTVEVLDPTQSLELTAHKLQCEITQDEQIERAEVIGTERRPASVRLETLTVTGQTVRLNVPDQWAEVPGPGRMVFRSQKDLDGRKLDAPVPIAVTWTDWMKYHGRENQSIFQGNVHATSESTTTFDCDRLLAEFSDVAPPAEGGQDEQDWWIFSDLAAWATDRSDSSAGGGLASRGFSKELTQILATGNAKAQTSEFEDGTDKLKSRATIAGPSILVILLDNVSKMSIEGKGYLQMEDYRLPDEDGTAQSSDIDDGLFGLAENEGQSVTLIEWDELMSYDFSIDQTLFRGVTLTYLSGQQLAATLSGHARRPPPPGPSTGRHTKLTCDSLSVGFMRWQDRGRTDRPRRFGRLSAARLRQFSARGSVVLLDPGHLSLAADKVVYEKDRDILVVHGTEREKAHIIVEREHGLPQDFKAKCFFYNTKSKVVEVQGSAYRGR